jgi:transposase
VRFKVIRHVRPKLACASCDTIVQAPAPTRPIERGMAGPGLLAHVIVGKYGSFKIRVGNEALDARRVRKRITLREAVEGLSLRTHPFHCAAAA